MPFTLRAAAVAIVINVLWGGNTVAVKIGLTSFPPLTSAFLRFALGLGCVAGWAVAMRYQLLPRRGDWGGLLGLAALFAVQIVLMNFGLERTSAGACAVLIATHPLFAALLAHFYLTGDRLSWRRGAGLALAFVGTAFVVLDGSTAPGGLDWVGVGNVLALLSGALLGARLVLTARLLERREPAVVIGWQMLLSLPVFLAGALALETVDWNAVTWRAGAGIAYQGIVIAGLGFMTVAYLLKRYAASTTVSFGFLTPVSGVALGALLLDEPFTWPLALGVSAVGAGLVLVARGGR